MTGCLCIDSSFMYNKRELMIISNKYWIIFKTNYVIINMTKCSIQFRNAQINRSSPTCWRVKSIHIHSTQCFGLWLSRPQKSTVWLKKNKKTKTKPLTLTFIYKWLFSKWNPKDIWIYPTYDDNKQCLHIHDTWNKLFFFYLFTQTVRSLKNRIIGGRLCQIIWLIFFYSPY